MMLLGIACVCVTHRPYDPAHASSRRSTASRRVPPIPCREDFATAAELYFKKLGRAVEIGVYRGIFARHNLRTWTGNYTMIDYWGKRPHDRIDNNMNNQVNRALAEQNVAPYAGRIEMVKSLSVPAASLYNAEHFDWIYVDALHTYEAVLADVRAWWPKLRHGGLLSGDDYGDMRDTPFVTRERYLEYYGNVSLLSQWGTIRAMQEFVDEVDRQLFVTWMKPSYDPTSIIREGRGCYSYPAWYMIK